MSQFSVDPGQEHLNAIHDLIGYLLERCPRHFDQEMDERFKQVITSFSRFRQTSETFPKFPSPDDLFSDDSLGRNFLIVQCSVLVRFVNSVQVAVAHENVPEIAQKLEQLWDEWRSLYKRFFAESIDFDL